MLPYTTLRELRQENACIDRYKHLKKSLGSTFKDDTPINLVTIMEHNGLSDALWVPESIVHGALVAKRYRLFAVACCQDVLRLITDARSINAVRVVHLFAHSEATKEELDAAGAAAWAAAGAAAGDAARDAAGAAAWAAAWDAAGAAARAAARAAAGDAAGDAARAAAWDAAGAKQAEHFKIIFGTNYV
jgi:hypothetical protein